MKISYKVENQGLIVDITDISPEFFGLDAVLSLKLKVDVKDSRPINSHKTLLKEKIIINSVSHRVVFSSCDTFYNYSWEKINISPELVLVVNDSILFDTKLTQKVTRELSKLPRISNRKASRILNPKDTFNLLFNLKSISNFDKIKVIWLMCIGAWVITVNTLVGLHDQVSPENMTYFYTHYDSDGDYSSPFFKSLAWSGAVWAWIWFLIRMHLRRYMSFLFRKVTWVKWIRNHRYKISELLKGKSRVDLHNVTLKIVAWNIEKWQYTRWSGTNKRTVSFAHPIRAVELFSQQYDLIPKNTQISDYLLWDMSFEEMYNVLYPELMTWETHGLETHWEVQLIHDKLIDQELVWPKEICQYSFFLDAK